jgi:hypothetical protein
MTREQRVEAWQRVDVLEGLVGTRSRVPLVIAFGVDTDQEVQHCYRS